MREVENVRLTKASVDTLPFPDEAFDFAMSIGVLHHIPDTQQAMNDCVKKVKKGGYFYVYLYYNLDKRGSLFKILFKLTDVIRSVVSKFPGRLKKIICDILAVIIYMPLILWVRFLVFIGLRRLAKQMPLSAYNNKSFFIPLLSFINSSRKMIIVITSSDFINVKNSFIQDFILRCY